MGRRRKAREDTLRILFRLEFENKQIEKTLDQYWKSKKASEEIKEYSTWLVNGVISDQAKIDNIIQQVSEHWRISRMALVDRNILRMAVFELLYEENIAPAIVINEAIEIAKKYSGEEAATFVNGILDAVRKDLKDIKKSLEEKEHA
ncbi:MAG: transcription antitermination factor NusB [Candidatus Aminicenantes bacterium]|nr:transcription antitermination factor NusB [Candidatus Aminicenantes bacterium]TET71047.1 MAG: transcription antitermination factor NusB [Candidatus Aminicenantes bacterium]